MAKNLYDEIMLKKENIKATASKRKKRMTQIWKDFEESYQKDLDVSWSFVVSRMLVTLYFGNVISIIVLQL